MKLLLRSEALKLRKDGFSYGMIKQKLGVSKSTLSNWLSGIPFTPNEALLNRVGKAKLKSAMYNHKLKMDSISRMKVEAREEVGGLSNRDIFMLGIGLYLGEGTKSIEEVRIVNADPTIINLGIQWLKKFAGLKDENLYLAIHGYPDHNPEEIKRYWSQQTGIPLTRFGKTIIDNRQNKSVLKNRKLPFGTAHLCVKKGVSELSVKGLHRKIIGWIEASTKQIV